MTKLILCEGKTDAVFLSYYMEIVWVGRISSQREKYPKVLMSMLINTRGSG